MPAAYDERYWGPGGIDLSRWGKGEVARGARYRDVGPTTDGAKNQRRSISAGRKPRGLSSNDLEKQAVIHATDAQRAS
jgi:hypothetical protein